MKRGRKRGFGEGGKTNLARRVGHTPHYGAASGNPLPHHRDGRSSEDGDEQLALESFGHAGSEEEQGSELRLAAVMRGRESASSHIKMRG